MNDPYDSVDWDTVTRLHSVNHVHTFSGNTGHDYWERTTEHLDGPAVFEDMYASGIRHFAISNYHPAKPTYPLERYFADVPANALGCPNGEHHSNEVSGHYCTVGSYFQSGDGYEASWQQLFDDALAQLAYPDGGGIVINHPRRTGLSIETLETRFDYDDRVLGIEAYNHRSEHKPKYDRTGDATGIWDTLLERGRQVFGFFNPDSHSRWRPAPSWTDQMGGRNVLLVDATTEAAAARAYRGGQTYGALYGTGLTFERISADAEELVVETNESCEITVIADGAVTNTVTGDYATHAFTDQEYVRIEAADGTGERIFSQPIRPEMA